MANETAETLKLRDGKTDLQIQSLGAALNSYGSAKQKAKQEEVANSPEAVMEQEDKASRVNRTFIFPRGLRNSGSTDYGPYMQITAYKYKRGFRELGETKDEGADKNTERYYSVRLPIPPNVSQEYSAHHSEFQGSAAFDAAANAVGGSELAKAAAGFAAASGASFLQKEVQRFVSGANVLQNIMGAQGAIRNQTSSQAGISINPRYELSFDTMNLRSHSFEFTLVPTSKEEAEEINEFIHKLRRSMHPTPVDLLGANAAFYLYPDEFLITFHDQFGEILAAVPPIPDCALSDFQVTAMTARLHADSSPVSTRIAMQFKEMKVLDRKIIDQLSGFK